MTQDTVAPAVDTCRNRVSTCSFSLVARVPYARARWTIPAMGMVCLLLAAILAACTPASPGPAAFPKGKLTVLPAPASYTLPGQMVRGPDGHLWFPAIAYENFATDRPGGAIGRITSAGTFQMFPLPGANCYPTALTVARDGTIWFTAFQGNGELAPNVDTAPHFTGGENELGRMTPDGQFHLFTLPAPNVSLTSIATGPDGNLWFTENLANDDGTTSQQIGRMTPAGTFSTFPVTAPFAKSYLRQIIAGPDDTLWFSLEGTDASYHALGAIGKITPQGAITIMQLGMYTVPSDMTIGPDRNLWFSTGFEVGYVTPDGKAHLLDPDPHAKAGNHLDLGGITTGPDGALWFATANVEVGRVTTSGAFSFYPFPDNDYSFDNGSSSLTLGDLKGIATSADGTLWLTDAGQIGHFV